MQEAAARAILNSPAPRRRLRVAPVPGAVPDVLLVANGNASGVGRLDRLVEGVDALLRSFGARVETLRTESGAEFEAVWDVASARRVVLVGGDGTVHAAANAPGPRPELALVPAGKANNIARSVGIPTDTRTAVEGPFRGRARALDLIAARSSQRSYLAVEGSAPGSCPSPARATGGLGVNQTVRESGTPPARRV